MATDSPPITRKMGDVGYTAADNRLFINRTGESAVLCIARSGAPWRDLPERFGLWNSTCQRFRRWAKADVWRKVFEELQAPDLDWLMIDSTIVRAHQHASGQKKSDPASESLGQSVGGWSTKIHAAVDALGNPLRIILTVGQRADTIQAASLVAGYEPDAILADRGYDAALVDLLNESEIGVVISSKRNRLTEQVIDKNLCQDRNKVERYFNKLKQYRRVATRYEKTAVSFARFMYLASTMILLQ